MFQATLLGDNHVGAYAGQRGKECRPSTSLHNKEPSTSYSPQSEPMPPGVLPGPPQRLHCMAWSSPAHVLRGYRSMGIGWVSVRCEPQHLLILTYSVGNGYC